MQRIKDIQTPKTLDQFRVNLKKFCLGSKNNIFIFNKSDGKDYKVDVEKISKISDVINLIGVREYEKSICFIATLHFVFLSIPNLTTPNDPSPKSSFIEYILNNSLFVDVVPILSDTAVFVL